MWGEVLYGAGHQYDTSLLPALVRQRPFGGLWPAEEPTVAARAGRKRPRDRPTPVAASGRRPEPTALGVGLGRAGSYGFCSTAPAAPPPPLPPPGLMQGVLPKTVSQRIYKCTWKGCGVIYNSCPEITQHVRNAHLGPRKPNEYSDEEDFFFTETEDESDESAPKSPSPPTLSHRDMARPPHEDPEYQRQITSPQKHVRLSPRPSASYPYPSPNYQHHYQAQAAQQQQQHHQQQLGHIQLSPGGATASGNNGTAAYHQLLVGAAGASGALALGAYSTSSSSSGGGSSVGSAGSGQHRSPVSPNRRTRGENKKCRKVYGMDHKDQWCTQCKWKKACSRFGD
uniref:C2H2-type domain-containing protein n=1 Tax=Anopheles farauti TaxID=69004 RepID=A0A182Q4Q0_9DIPT